MTQEKIHAIARQHQIEFDGLTINEIIRKIQLRKGQFDCFATAYDGECKYAGCRWRKACLLLSIQLFQPNSSEGLKNECNHNEGSHPATKNGEPDGVRPE